MSQKLVVVDIDATLIDSPKQKVPSDEFVKVVQDIKNDALITCATGRSWSWARPVLEHANFTAPCIIGGGTLLLNPETLEIIEENLLPPGQLDNIKTVLKDYPTVHVLFNDYTEEDYLGGGWELSTLVESNECYIMEIVMVTHELADELIAKFKVLEGITSVKMNSFEQGLVDVHVVSERSTKEHGIATIQKMFGISKEDTIGIGDGHNDLHIFYAVGIKVAVGNAVPELKELADEIIDDVTKDPVTSYLKGLASKAKS